MIEVAAPGKPSQFYADLNPVQAHHLIQQLCQPRGLLRRLSRFCARAPDSLLQDSPSRQPVRYSMSLRDRGVKAFLGKQVHLATEQFGQLDPLNFNEYLAHGGFQAWDRCRKELTQNEIIDRLEQAGLRGRGGAGFPTGPKWRLALQQEVPVKYVICNGDEGDPGAFMDRILLESFPFRIIEGVAIAGRAIGANEAMFYIRHEYPLAVKYFTLAVEKAREYGLLGRNILGKEGFSFDVQVSQGGGSFVCGECSALMASQARDAPWGAHPM